MVHCPIQVSYLCGRKKKTLLIFTTTLTKRQLPSNISLCLHFIQSELTDVLLKLIYIYHAAPPALMKNMSSIKQIMNCFLYKQIKENEYKFSIH